MTMLNLLALSWADSLTIVGVVGAVGFVIVCIGDAIFSSRRKGAPELSAARIEGIEDDLAIIRTQLADIKATLTELDRMFKSVG